ncbi:MAG TPA: Ig-like domain-containing protein, partial [Iamia sp.]|nr:Ig-like domain-containing protein [Iamia sp.]
MRIERAVVAIVVALSGVLVGLTGAPPVAALSNQPATFTGLACVASPSANGSSWGAALAPSDVVAAQFTIVGGGGGGGRPDVGSGGVGGGGGVVTGKVPVTPGQVLWARVGCGGTQTPNLLAGGWSRGGWASGPRAGGGGGSTGLCLGTGTASCAGGTMVSIASGGGGGGGGARNGFFSCSPANGGSGGIANLGSLRPAHGGTARGGGRGARASVFSNAPRGDGGGGGGGGGQGPTYGPTTTTIDDQGGAPGGDGFGASPGSPMSTTPPVDPGPSGSGGAGSRGEGVGVGGGGGGGGYTGGGGGGGGRDAEPLCFTDGGAGGGGAGASWARSSVLQPTFAAMATSTGGCSGTIFGPGSTPAGAGGASGGLGCSGSVSVTWIRNQVPTGAGATYDVQRGVARSFTLAASDPDGDLPLTCEILSGPTQGSLAGSGCARTYTAGMTAQGRDTLSYRVRDGQGAVSAPSTVTFVLPQPANRAPTAEDQALTVAPSSLTTITLGGSDPDGDSTSCYGFPPTGGSFEGGTGCAPRYRAPAALGTYTFDYVRYDAT